MRSALAFLTTLPVGASSASLRRSTVVGFPLAGLIVGLSWWLVASVGGQVWTPAVAAALVLVVDLVITGALHLDAVADTADGLGSRRRGDELRAVLADARIGAIGAAALGTVLLVRITTLSVLVAGSAPVLLVLVPAIGRVGMVAGLAASPRTAGSLTSELTDLARGPASAAAVGVLVAATLLVGGLTGQLVALGVAALAGTGCALVVAVAWRRCHGFASGDVIGAAGLLAETVGLLVLAAG